MLRNLYFFVQRYDEFDATETYLVIIPGLEGHYEIFERISERLKIPAVVLQPPPEHNHETVEQLAKRFVSVRQIFYLLYYCIVISAVISGSYLFIKSRNLFQE